MSHTSTYKHKIKDMDLFVTLARALGYEARTGENIVVHHFATAHPVFCNAAIKFPGWKYEIAVKADGEIQYDHWGSQHNSFDKLGHLIQSYNKQIITEAIPYFETKNVNDTLETNGDIKLVLEYA